MGLVRRSSNYGRPVSWNTSPKSVPPAFTTTLAGPAMRGTMVTSDPSATPPSGAVRRRYEAEQSDAQLAQPLLRVPGTGAKWFQWELSRIGAGEVEKDGL